MIRRPPRSTRTDTLFPYTPLFRSGDGEQAVVEADLGRRRPVRVDPVDRALDLAVRAFHPGSGVGSWEEHTSELQSLMRSSFAVFCLITLKPATGQHFSKRTMTLTYNRCTFFFTTPIIKHSHGPNSLY